MWRGVIEFRIFQPFDCGDPFLGDLDPPACVQIYNNGGNASFVDNSFILPG
jgi:hypothetical protein